MHILLLGASIVVATLQSLFSRLYSDRYPRATGMASALAYAVFYGAFIGFATLALEGFAFAASSATWILGVANALVLSLYNLSLLQAGISGGYAAMMVSLLSGGILVPAVSNAVFLGQALGAAQLAGIALLLLAIVLMNLRGLSVAGQSRKFYLWCALLFLSNGLYGALLSAQAQLAAGAQRGEMIAITYFGSALGLRDPAVLPRAARILPGLSHGAVARAVRAGRQRFGHHRVQPCAVFDACDEFYRGQHRVQRRRAGGFHAAFRRHAARKTHAPAVLGLVVACAGIVLMGL